MKNLLLASAAMVCLTLAAPAWAQDDSGAAPADQSGAQTGADGSAKPMMRHHRHHRTSQQDQSGDANDQTGARPGHEPGVGDSEPMSTKASNIDHADSRSGIAPRLPAPTQGANGSMKQYLHDAMHDLDIHRTGAAQEALERAETRQLDRVSQTGGNPVQDPTIMNLNGARKALASGDMKAAKDAIGQAMQSAMGGDMGGQPGMSGGMNGGSVNGQPMQGGMMNGQPMTQGGMSGAPMGSPAMAPNGMTNQPGGGGMTPMGQPAQPMQQPMQGQ